MQVINKEFNFSDGRTLTVETGKLAKQADGSVVLKMGDTMLLATVVSAQKAIEGTDFMPLTIDYREKFASTGRMPGGFHKRESRPSNEEILVMRLVDRALRPLFPSDYHADTQVMISLISADKEICPDALACFAASAALAVSDIPFQGPVSEVRVGRINGTFQINPNHSLLAESDLDMIIAGTVDNILMVEGELKEVSEADMLAAIEFAHAEIKRQCQFQIELAAMVEKAKTKRVYQHETHDLELKAQIQAYCYEKCYQIAKSALDKKARGGAFEELENQFIEAQNWTAEEKEQKKTLVSWYFGDVEKLAMRRMILDENVRLDGRNTKQIRPIWSEVNYLPACHGSAVFTRGETQSLTSLTLGTKLDAQSIDGAVYAYTENFMLHYNFPPFSTGEIKPLRGVGRREIGHGNLAQRALKYVLPTDFPYTVRLVSDVLESNGSSSMATVCAGTLALMDGGVQIKAPVSGIAMGLIMDENGKYAILSDILGDEDHLGDMDFKVTGTEKGITACQMDMKVEGLSAQVLKEALEQARQGRLHILGEILKTLAKPNEDFKSNVPRMVFLEIPSDMIGPVIGPGGKIIQDIQAKTGTTIVLEEDKERKLGLVYISGVNKDGVTQAEATVRRIAFPAKAEVGEVYAAKVVSIVSFGAFVELLPGLEALLHISEVANKRLESLEGVLTVGQTIDVKVTGLDQKTKKLKVSHKVLLPKQEKEEQN
jgi:polyribonucleotide nucleotidyltransferase